MGLKELFQTFGVIMVRTCSRWPQRKVFSRRIAMMYGQNYYLFLTVLLKKAVCDYLQLVGRMESEW